MTTAGQIKAVETDEADSVLLRVDEQRSALCGHRWNNGGFFSSAWGFVAAAAWPLNSPHTFTLPASLSVCLSLGSLLCMTVSPSLSWLLLFLCICLQTDQTCLVVNRAFTSTILFTECMRVEQLQGAAINNCLFVLLFYRSQIQMKPFL